MFAEYVYLFIEGTQPFDSSVSSDLIAIDFTYVYLETQRKTISIFFSRKAPRHYIKVNNKKKKRKKKEKFR